MLGYGAIDRQNSFLDSVRVQLKKHASDICLGRTDTTVSNVQQIGFGTLNLVKPEDYPVHLQ
jgi:hypothetical protein